MEVYVLSVLFALVLVYGIHAFFADRAAARLARKELTDELTASIKALNENVENLIKSSNEHFSFNRNVLKETVVQLRDIVTTSEKDKNRALASVAGNLAMRSRRGMPPP